MEKFIKNLNTLTRILPVLGMLLALEVKAQPDYSFTAGTLISGTNLQENARYRFNNVRSGVDAILTISDITPGIGLTQLDGASGYPATIQPTITATPWTNGYVELTIQFVTGGTNTPMNQPQLAFTAFDVDGVTNYDGQGHNLHEFDQVNMGGGYADFNAIGGELSVSQSGDWFTGTNISGTDYPGRDTSAQQVMFSVINVNVTTVVVRVGVNNQTANAASRLRCVYFKKFNYNNSILALHDGERIRRQTQTAQQNAGRFGIYPTVVQDNATISVNASRDGWASFEVFDYSGRMLMKQQLVINRGDNRIPFFGASKMHNGNYVALLKMDGEVYHQKVIKQ